MEINITCGQYANDYFTKTFDKVFIPFNEAMIQGNAPQPLFDEAFIEERCQTHHVSIEEYKTVMKDFLLFTKEIHQYSSIILWFGEDAFCQANLITLFAYFKQEKAQEKVTINIINEITYEILYQNLTIEDYQKIYHH